MTDANELDEQEIWRLVFDETTDSIKVKGV